MYKIIYCFLSTNTNCDLLMDHTVKVFCKIKFINLLFSFIAFSSLADPITIEGVPRVVDGDTLWISQSKIRLHGIDAPEMKQECFDENNIVWLCGKESKKILSIIINSNEITCKGSKRDRYKRLIAKCYIDNVDIASLLVLKGFAVAYIRYSKDYIFEENHAREKKLGIWTGHFSRPSDWRRNN